MANIGSTLTPLGDTSTASMFAAMNAANTQAKANATSGASDSSSTSSDSNSLSADNLGSTFLELLSQELQNQDPTSPVDPTEMVGQMISLNQLDQLIGINQTLTDATGSSTTGTSSDAATGTHSVAGAVANASSNTAEGATGSAAAANAAAAQAYLNAAGALLAGTPASSSAPADSFNLSQLTALTGGK